MWMPSMQKRTPLHTKRGGLGGRPGFLNWLQVLLFVSLLLATARSASAAAVRRDLATPLPVHALTLPPPPVVPDTQHDSLEQLRAKAQGGGLVFAPDSRPLGNETEATMALFFSACSPRAGCPESSMVWASGSFTLDGLLTPASLLVPANLSLRLSLCCGYQFAGRMLVDAGLYDDFLEELLHASPFQSLAPEERRALFPITSAAVLRTEERVLFRAPADHPKSISNNKNNHRNESSSNVINGDVLLLHTGQLSAAAIKRVLENAAGNTGVPPPLQLRVTRRVLICKCPHSLLVRPPVRLRLDVLPPIRIRGLGAHCASLRPVSAALSPSSPSPSPSPPPPPPDRFLVQVLTKRGAASFSKDAPQEQAMRFATTFLIHPPLPPSTQVSWTIREGNATGVVVLRTSELLPVVRLYTHSGREDGFARSTAASPYVEIRPNVRYHIHVRVGRGEGGPAPVLREASGAFLLRLPFADDGEVISVAPAPHFGFLRSLRLSPAVAARVRAAGQDVDANYFGYWAPSPRSSSYNGEAPPAATRVVLPSLQANDTVAVPLEMGQNDLSFFIQDLDQACGAVVLERREIWALQARLLAPLTIPTTACAETLEVRARGLGPVLRRLQTEPGLAVGMLLTESQPDQTARTGHFSCQLRRTPTPEARGIRPVTEGAEPACEVLNVTVVGDEICARLRLRTPGLYEVVWSITVDFTDAGGAKPEYFEPPFATVVSGGPDRTPGRMRVRLQTPPLLVVRRLPLFPDHVQLRLLMHRREWTVPAPSPVATDPNSPIMPPEGYWIAREPLAILVVDEHQRLTLDTTRVPNQAQRLPPRTLQFVVQDPGEALSRTYGLPPSPPCPDFLIEVEVEVFATRAPCITADRETLYTAESAVLLRPPRAARKDETVRWEFRQGGSWVVGQPPFLTPHVLTPSERASLALRDGSDTEQEGLEDTEAAVPVPAEAWTGVVVRGLEPYRPYEVVWTATNALGMVQKFFFIRRCQEPPPVFFHPRGLPANASTGLALRLPDWLLDEDARIEIPTSSPTTTTTTPTTTTTITDATTRMLLPVAGETVTLSYVFNFSGLQDHFEASFLAVPDEAADQRWQSQAHIEASTTTRLRWRRRAHVGLVHRVPSLDLPERAIPPEGTRTFDVADKTLTEAQEEEQDRTTAAALDTEVNGGFRLEHEPKTRRLRLRGLAPAALYPVNYTVRAARQGPHALPEEDQKAFAQRGLCPPREGKFAVLALSPRGVVFTGEAARIKGSGAWLGPPRTPAVQVLPFCTSQFRFARHPDLHRLYGYDFTWDCEDGGGFVVQKQAPTETMLRPVASTAAAVTNCRLTVHNRITQTQHAEWFSLKRVSPSDLTDVRLRVLSDNVALTTATAAPAKPGRVPIPKVYGKSFVLHVNYTTPPPPMASRWEVTTFVPATASAVGPRVVVDAVRFTPLPYHPAARARRHGATVQVHDLTTPGIYTVAHHFPDPAYPGLCPDFTLTTSIEVLHAKVVTRELVLCSDHAVLRAAAIPKDLLPSFVGVWEVVSIQDAPEKVQTTGPSLGGVHFDHPERAETVVRGLPFGIVTLRWAVYKILAPGAAMSSSSSLAANKRILVDADTVQLIVLTEPVRPRYHLTLRETLQLPTTASASDWSVLAPNRTATAAGSSAQVQLTWRAQGQTDGTHGNATHASSPLSTSSLQLGGGGVLTLSHLPIGRVQVRYTLRASPRIFGPMHGHSCEYQDYFEVERVSAFLTAQTTLEGECAAYTGEGLMQLCLRANFSPDTVSNGTSQASAISLRWIALERLESVMKRGARALEARAGCQTPWWIATDTRWRRIRHLDAAGEQAKRCVQFRVTAGHYLGPAELAAPLFLATTPDRGRPCESGDFIPSAILEEVMPLPTTATPASVAADGTQRTELSLGTSDNSADEDANEGRRLTRYLPILDPTTLQRWTNWTMRPLTLGPPGLTEVVFSELDLSQGQGPWLMLPLPDPTSSGPRPSAARGAMEKKDGGDPFLVDSAQALVGAASEPSARRNLILACAEGSLRAGDVLAGWKTLDPPAGVPEEVARVAADEWLSYLNAVKDVRVPCEILYPSLRHLLEEDAGEVLHQSMADRRRAGLWLGESNTSFLSSPSSRTGAASLIPLAEFEQQLVGLQQSYRWTPEGINITGLPSDLQHALRERRLTKRQLQALQRAREGALRRQLASRASSLSSSSSSEGGAGLALHTSLVDRLRETHQLAQHLTGAPVGVAGIRVRLPVHPPFAVPYTLRLRIALHKDVICGSTISAGRRAEWDALVELGRAEIRDVPAVVRHEPRGLKQCELESSPPAILVQLSGTAFSSLAFSPAQVELEELPNPDLPVDLRADAFRVGLRPCFPMMHDGLRVVVASETQKELSLQLGACPSLEMLAQEEYDEHQDSEALLRRLRYPRLLRVIIRDALRRDSHALSSASSTSAGVRSSSSSTSSTTDLSFTIPVFPSLARLHLRYGPSAPTPGLLHSSIEAATMVEPATSARSSAARRDFFTTPARPLLLCEAAMRRYGFDLGVELIGDRWTPGVGRGRQRADDVLRSARHPLPASSEKWSPSWPNHPDSDGRGLCEDVAILNSFSVVEHHGLDSTHHLYLQAGGVYRSHFVNYLASLLAELPRRQGRPHRFVRRFNDTFVRVEVPPMASTSVAADTGSSSSSSTTALPLREQELEEEQEDLVVFAHIWARQRDVPPQQGFSTSAIPHLPAGHAIPKPIPGPLFRRFSKIEEILFAVPGLATTCRGCVLSDTTFFVAGDLTGLWRLRTNGGGKAASAGGEERAAAFNFASPPPLDHLRLSRPLVVPWYAAGVIPQRWDFHWVCPPAARASLIDFEAVWRALAADESSLEAYLEMDVVAYQLRDRTGAPVPFGERPAVLASSEPVRVRALLQHPHTRPGEAGLSPVSFRLGGGVTQSAYALVAADLRRRPRSTSFDYHRVQPSAWRGREEAGGRAPTKQELGRLALNASVMVKVCLPDRAESTTSTSTSTSTSPSSAASSQSSSKPFCMVVSLSDTLLMVEDAGEGTGGRLRWRPFRRSATETGFVNDTTRDQYEQSHNKDSTTRRRSSRHSFFSLTGLLHEVVLAALFYYLLPATGLLGAEEASGRPAQGPKVGVLKSGTSGRHFLPQDAPLAKGSVLDKYRAQEARQVRRHVFALVFFLFLCISDAYAPKLWVGAWLILWVFTVNWSQHPGAILYWCLSAVYRHYL